MSHEKNPVIEIYKGVNIRHSNVVVLKFGIAQYKKLLDEVDRTGFPISKIIAYGNRPCQKCSYAEFTCYDKEGKIQIIKRGLLSIPEGNGINIIQQSKNRK